MRKVLLTVVIVLGFGGAWSCASKAQSVATVEPALAQFQISVEKTANGVNMECVRGCAWLTLNFHCDGQQTCKSTVDSLGMKPTPTK